MTFEKNIYVIFAVLMNLLTLALVIRLFLSLHSGHVRKSLTAFSFSYLVWLNGIITLRLFDLSYSVSNLIVEIQLIGVNLMIHSFLYFVFAFSDPDQLERKRNLIFPFNLIFLTALILMGLIQSALIGENGYRPKYETVFPYFAVTLALTSIYGIYFMYSSYRRVSDEFIQFQYKYILIVSLITTTALTVAQGILPIFQGDNEITFYNNFIWPAVFIFAVFQLLSKGRILFLQSVFKDLIKFRDFRIEQNMPNLRKIIYAMKKVFEGSHGEMQKSFSFDLPNGKEYRFSFTGKNGRNQDRWLIQEPLNSSRTMNRITGLLDVILDMESENRRLLGLLAKAKTYLNGQVKIQEQTDEHSIVSGIIGSLQIGENIKRNKPQVDEHKKIFGQHLSGKTIVFYEMLTKIRMFSPSEGPILFKGEPGCGKSLFARAMHFYRKGGELFEFSCMGKNSDEIKIIISDFLKKSSKAPGILVRHLDTLRLEDFGIFEPLLADFQSNRYVYFTASNDIQLTLDSLRPSLKNRFNQLIMEIKPLRNMKDDILNQVFAFIVKHTDENLNGFQYLDPKFVDSLLSYDWPGNSFELENVIKMALLQNSPPVLKTAEIGDSRSRIPMLSENSSLSPLEESEKIVISRYLKKNHFNKSKTKRELKITINTLNAKIKRYGIGEAHHL